MLRTLVLASLAILSTGYPRVVSDEEDIEIALSHINEARRAGGYNDLTWDEPLEKAAQSWADKIANGEVPFSYRPARYPISGQAIYEEETATDCVGQSFEATLQSAAGAWLRKWEPKFGKKPNTNYDACMKSNAVYVGCGKSHCDFAISGGKKCTFYDVCFFAYSWPPSSSPSSSPPEPTQKPTQEPTQRPSGQHWGHTIYIPTPVKYTPIKDSEDEAMLEFPDQEE